jgi:hypothetical protein
MIKEFSMLTEVNDLRLQFILDQQNIDAVSAALQTLGCAETERGLETARLEQMPLVIELSGDGTAVAVDMRLVDGAINFRRAFR